MSILGVNNIKRAEELAEQYVLWQREIANYEIVVENIRKEIIALMKLENVDKVGKVRLNKTFKFEPIEIKDIQEQFNDKKIADSVVVKIDYESTKRNFKIINGWNDNLIEQVLERLTETTKTTYDELEIKEK